MIGNSETTLIDLVFARHGTLSREADGSSLVCASNYSELQWLRLGIIYVALEQGDSNYALIATAVFVAWVCRPALP